MRIFLTENRQLSHSINCLLDEGKNGNARLRRLSKLVSSYNVKTNDILEQYCCVGREINLYRRTALENSPQVLFGGKLNAAVKQQIVAWNDI